MQQGSAFFFFFFFSWDWWEIVESFQSMSGLTGHIPSEDRFSICAKNRLEQVESRARKGADHPGEGWWRSQQLKVATLGFGNGKEGWMRQILKRQKQQELEIEGMWGGGGRAKKPLSRVAFISDKSALNWKHKWAVLRPLGPDSTNSLI